MCTSRSIRYHMLMTNDAELFNLTCPYVGINRQNFVYWYIETVSSYHAMSSYGCTGIHAHTKQLMVHAMHEPSSCIFWGCHVHRTLVYKPCITQKQARVCNRYRNRYPCLSILDVIGTVWCICAQWHVIAIMLNTCISQCCLVGTCHLAGRC